MKPYKSEITGHLDLFVADNKELVEGETEQWQSVLIHGDPEGLRSFAQLLLRLADLEQDAFPALPPGARAHISLRPNLDLSNSSVEVVVGRLDAKGTGAFYDRYLSKGGDK
ncbi:Imm32 family immunity protein [Hymenobacter sp. B1770]|uniref:Imm32 family immunity protein n=1 Tax=Hymenobacter sp. B1770 TaxID=1718788 RepID=UPI003CF9B0B6